MKIVTAKKIVRIVEDMSTRQINIDQNAKVDMVYANFDLLPIDFAGVEIRHKGLSIVIPTKVVDDLCELWTSKAVELSDLEVGQMLEGSV
jgi:hypothetical protein